MVDKRFLHDLPAIIANAREGNKIACFNIIQYIKEMAIKCETPNDGAVRYLQSALSNLTESERKRVAKGLAIPINEASPARLLESFPKMSNAATKRLVEKITAKKGRKKLGHEDELDNIEIGAEVAKLQAKYKDYSNPDYRETKQLRLEPKERAVEEVAKKYDKSKATIKRMYSLFKKYQEWGFIDEDGNFILLDQKKK